VLWCAQVSYAYIGTRVALAETHSNEGSTRSKNVVVLFSSRLIVFSHYHIDARRVVEAKPIAKVLVWQFQQSVSISLLSKVFTVNMNFGEVIIDLPSVCFSRRVFLISNTWLLICPTGKCSPIMILLFVGHTFVPRKIASLTISTWSRPTSD